MPDHFRFDHLRDVRHCIDCDVRGPASDWPEHRRQQHFEAHQKERRKQAERAARQRARAALRLKAQLKKENDAAYKKPRGE